jgi:hypothetical protein
LTGHLESLAFPDICAHCGDAASEHLRIDKVFEVNYSDSPRSYTINSVAVLFCPRCIEIHWREVRKFSVLERLVMCLHAGEMLAGLCSGAFATFLVFEAIRRGRGGPDAVLAGVAAVFAGISYLSYRHAYGETQHLAVPPLTSVTGSFDFTGVGGDLYDGPRRTYTLRNSAFRDAFVLLNRELTWNPGSPQARQAESKRKVTTVIAVAVVAGLVVWEIVKALLP